MFARWAADGDEYKPLSAPGISSADPQSVIDFYSSLAEFDTYYIADLDAIMNNRDRNKKLIEATLTSNSFEIWLDNGYVSIDDVKVQPLMTPVIATETFKQWDQVVDLSKTIVSIDSKNSKILSASGMSQGEIIGHARKAGARKFIHMRLEAVGAGGLDPSSLMTPAQDEHWYAGGGVRGPEDLVALEKADYQGALVSTALLNGALL